MGNRRHSHLCLQNYCTGLLEVCAQQVASKQAPELPLPTGFIFPWLQQLLWLLGACASAQVDPKASAALQAPDNLSLLALLPHRHLNLLLSARSLPPHRQVKLRLYAFLFCWCQEASLPTEHWGPAFTNKPSHGRISATPSKRRNPASPLSGNMSFCGCQKTCFPSAKGPDHGRTPASLL
jgi:hypothetical protein